MWHMVDLITAILGRPRSLRSLLQANAASWFMQFDSALFTEEKAYSSNVRSGTHFETRSSTRLAALAADLRKRGGTVAFRPRETERLVRSPRLQSGRLFLGPLWGHIRHPEPPREYVRRSGLRLEGKYFPDGELPDGRSLFRFSMIFIVLLGKFNS